MRDIIEPIMSEYATPPSSELSAAAGPRMVPQAIEAEEALLGSVLINPEAYYDAASFLRPDDFYLHKNAWIWETFVSLHDQRVPIDFLTVSEELERHNRLNEIGGQAYLTRLINNVPTSLHAEAYGRLVEQVSIRRRLLGAANDIAKLAYEESADIEEVVNSAEKSVFEVSERRLTHDLEPIKQVLGEYYDRIDYLSRHRDERMGVPTGFIDLDRLLGGLQKSDLLIIAGRPGQGKCLAANSEIVLEDGTVATIEAIYRQQSARLLTLQENLRLSFTSPCGFLDDGIKPTYRVTTALGRSVECTLTHPFLTLRGWRPLSELGPGDRVAVPRVIPVFGDSDMRECEIKLLAYLTGDGCLVHSSPEFIVGKHELKEDFEAAVRAFGGIRSTYLEPARRTPYIAVTNGEGRRARGVKNPLTDWLRSLGVYGLDSHHKFIPDCIFRLPKPGLALFLNRLFATDGWVTSSAAEIGYASVSERLIRQIQHLLLRFEVIAGIRRKTIKGPTKDYAAWHLRVTDAPSLLAFIGQIGVYGKEEKAERMRRRLQETNRNTNTDTVPVEIWEDIRESKGAEPWVGLAHRAGIQLASPKINLHAGKRSPSRGRLLQLAHALGDTRLTELATSDVYWDTIRSIASTGDQQVYDLTIPDTHNFVANDVCVHNTGFMLSAAKNAAQLHKKRVAIFSLEMSNEQLVQRLISQETGMDSQRLRLGNLSDDEWPLFTHAVSVLGDTPIFLDDTPAISALQLRTKCRRLHAEFGLDLVVVDYLQLMTGDTRQDNRVQEVSYISRNLKVLARELNVPVLAGAQLSRAVEQRTDKKPVLSDLRESGCLTGDTLIALASGELRPMASLVGERPEVITLDGWRASARTASRVWKTGHRPVFRLTTRTGRRIRATGNHAFRVLEGWRALAELKVGDRIAIPRAYPEPLNPKPWPEERLILLAHLVGDGCYASRVPIHYTSTSAAGLDAVARAAQVAFGIQARRVMQENWYHLYLSAGANKWHPNPLTQWLRDLGIAGQRSPEKVLPDGLFALGSGQLALFLRHLWATDGSIYLRKTTHGQTGTVYYSTTSERLARQVQHLLARLGILSRIAVVRKSEYRPNYHVHVMGRTDQLRFAATVGAFGDREAPLARLVKFYETVKANTNTDTIPSQVWGQVKSRMRALGVSQRKMATLRGTAYGGDGHFGFSPSRAVLAQHASLLEPPELQAVAESDVHWDTVAEIEALGTEDVYDMSVPGTHNFVANGIVVHNSLEQDADVVMFIYRPDQYEKDTAKHNIAEIIVAKHRNGPVGSIELVFRSSLAKFENAETKRIDLRQVG